MFTEQRKQLLLARLKKDGRLIAKDVSEELDLSEDTIRRDLRELAAQGLLARVHGGALPASPTVVKLAARRERSADEKARLGRAAVALMARGQTTFIDGGTSNLEIIRHLPLDYTGTIVTHAPAIAAALEFHEGVAVRVVGGTLYRHSMVAVGAAALEAIMGQSFDLAFIGATGFDTKAGLTTGDHEEALIKRAIIKRAAETICLLTQEKLGTVSNNLVAPACALASVIVVKEAKLKAPVEILRAP